MAAAKQVWFRAVLVTGGLVALFVVTHLAGHVWAVRRAARWQSAVESELRAEAASRLAWRLPAVAEDPGNDATCDSAAMIMTMMRDTGPPRPDPQSTSALPLVVTDPLVDVWLEDLDAASPALLELEVALSCTRLRAAPDHAPYWMSGHVNALLLRESWGRARRTLAGSPGPPAAESALLLLRLSLLRAAEGKPALYDAESALVTLARVVAGRGAGMDTGSIGARLAALEGAMPPADAQSADRHRQLLSLAQGVDEAQLLSHAEIQSTSWSPAMKARFSAGRALFPDAMLQVLALEHADRYVRDAGAALDADDTIALDAVRASSAYSGGWNVAEYQLPGYEPLHAIGRRHLRASLALAWAALRLEDARLRDAAYPEQLPDDARLRDPFGRGPLRYVPTADRRGYRLWSVGDDGADAGGGFGEVLVEALEVAPP
ncbi:MAG: hypothetical protein WKG00_03815 [Polyangiaceae bacterium]